MKTKETKNTTTKAEEIVTVTAEALEVATKGEIEMAKLQKESVKNSKEEEKLQKGKVDENGKYTVTILYEGDGPMAYVLDQNCKKIRLSAKFTYKLIEDGRAVKITPEEFNQIVKTKKSENKKATENKKAADK